MHAEAKSAYKGDECPSLVIPRERYGQSQGLAEIFGARLVEYEAQPGLYHPVPCVETAADVDKIKLKPIGECMFGGASLFARHVYEATGGELAVRSPIYTGPIDTANYLLGTTRLMEWIYDEPAALKKLLEMITGVLIEAVKAYQEAVCFKTAPELIVCADKGFMICSEVRHLISDEAYREFEAPYLKLMGESLGPFVIHSCGCVERSIRATAQDPNIYAADFQSRETDVAKALIETDYKFMLAIRMTSRIQEYEWPDEESYYRYLMGVFERPAPIQASIYDIVTYNRVREELDGGKCKMFRKV